MKRLTADELEYFFEQSAMIMNSGIPLAGGMDVMSEALEYRSQKDLAAELSRALNSEIPLFAAMEETGAFPPYAVKMVRIGDVSGRLEDVLKGLAEFYGRQAELRRTVKNAVFHPMILLSMMAAVITVLVIRVIPMFERVFSRFDAGIRESARGNVALAYNVGTVLLFIMLGAVISAVLAVASMNIKKLRSGMNSLLSNFILTERISEQIALARFCNGMTLCVASGIEPVTSLELSKELIDNKKILARIDACKELSLGGESFADSIDKTGLLPPIYAKSLKIAYNSGAFDVTWKKISDKCSEEADRRLYNAVSLIDPILIGTLAIMVGSILLTVMLPLMDIMSNL